MADDDDLSFSPMDEDVDDFNWTEDFKEKEFDIIDDDFENPVQFMAHDNKWFTPFQTYLKKTWNGSQVSYARQQVSEAHQAITHKINDLQADFENLSESDQKAIKTAAVVGGVGVATVLAGPEITKILKAKTKKVARSAVDHLV